MFPSFSFSLLSFLSKINKLKKKKKTHKKEKALTSVAQLAGHYHAERSLVQFPVRAHAWIVGLVLVTVPEGGHLHL